jgi:hypothetical protein
MKKKFFMFALVLLAINAGFVFAIDQNALWLSLKKGESASAGAINTLKRVNNATGVESNLDRIMSNVNTAEDAILDSMNYQETNGKLPTAPYQELVNQIKSNLRQIKSKMASFGVELSLAFDL